MFFVYGVYNNSLEMMFIRLGLLTRKVSGINDVYPFRFINPEGMRN